MVGTDYRRKVYACAIQNDSDSDIHVLLIYEEFQRGEEIKRTRSELDIAKGKKRYVIEKLVTCGAYNVREVINRIEVTGANGTKLELNAPFPNVTDPVTDWLFVVNDTEIQSVGPNK